MSNTLNKVEKLNYVGKLLISLNANFFLCEKKKKPYYEFKSILIAKNITVSIVLLI